MAKNDKDERKFLEDQIKIYNLRIKTNTKDYEAYYLKALTLIKLEKKDEALDCLDQAIKINSKIPIYYAYKAQLYAEAENYEHAKQALAKIDITKLSDSIHDKSAKNIVIEAQNKIQKSAEIVDRNVYVSIKEEQKKLEERVEHLEQEKQKLENKVDELQNIVRKIISDNVDEKHDMHDTLGSLSTNIQNY